MGNIINTLDFWKGQKTKIGIVATIGTFLFNMVFNIDISEQDLAECIVECLNQLEVLLTAGFAIYGAVFKIIRKLRK